MGDGDRKRVVRVERILDETVAGTVMLFDPESGRYMKLNSSGKALWAAIGSGSGVGLNSLASILETRFDIEPQAAADDAARFVDGLESAGFVRIV
jgi:2-phosphoglycerate kinase